MGEESCPDKGDGHGIAGGTHCGLSFYPSPFPQSMPSHWDANKFAVESESSPFPEVRSLGLAVAGEGLDCYLGDLNKNVAQPGHRLKDADAMACRVKLRLVEACEAGKAVGPSPCPQLTFSKEVLPFTVPKDPHDPYSTRVRPVFHFSADPADGPVHKRFVC